MAFQSCGLHLCLSQVVESNRLLTEQSIENILYLIKISDLFSENIFKREMLTIHPFIKVLIINYINNTIYYGMIIYLPSDSRGFSLF